MKKKSFKGIKLFMVIAIVLTLVGSVLASCVQSNFGKADVYTCTDKTLAQIAQTIEANNAATGRNIAVSFTKDAASAMTYKVLVPKTATKSTPAPAVVFMHGGLSNKNTPAPVYIDLVRRGFVVISFDAMGHGKTDKAVDAQTHNTMGFEAMVELAMSMPEVDPQQVGVTGHSWGNNGSAAVINAINLGTENPRIAAWLCGQGTLGIFDLKPGAIDGVTFGLSVGLYDEIDATYIGSYTFASNPMATGWIKEAYPDFAETTIPLGVWYDLDGGHELPMGTKFVGNGTPRVFYQPKNTHPGALFSVTGTKTNLDFFYGAFGVPAGNVAIDTNNQIWWLYIVGCALGMAGWFMLAMGFVTLLLKTHTFSSLRAVKDAEVINDKASLPSFKNPKESVPLLVMFLLLTVFAYFTMIPCTAAGAKLIPSSNFFPNAAHTSAALGFWSLMTALVAAVAVWLVAEVKRLMNKNDPSYQFQNPYSVAKLSFGKVMLSAILAFVAFAGVHAVLRVIDATLNVDFVIADLDITTFRIEKLFVMFRYMILCAPFYIINAILVANTRFKDVPDWASTAIVSIGNVLGLAILLFVEYSNLVATGSLISGDACSTFTVVWAMLLPMVVSPIIARYTYKRTGNIWVGALLNSFIFIMMQVGTGQYMIEAINITMFGL